MKQILITGASGFVGSRLSKAFLSKGDAVIGIGTSHQHPTIDEDDQFTWVSADTRHQGEWQDNVPQADVIINLAGRNIFTLWTQKCKQAIYDSRVLTTRHLVQAMDEGKNQTFLTTSAVGIYGDRKDDLLVEDNPPGQGYLSQVCKDWESEGLAARNKGARVCVMRFGVVLGRQGALAKMVPAFKMFAGGPLGTGRQWFPWIHIKDVEQAVLFLMEDTKLDGIFNFNAPGVVRQKMFASVLGKALHRPAFVPAPAFMVKTVLGELGSAFLESQRATPAHLTDSGYSFSFETVAEALADLFDK